VLNQLEPFEAAMMAAEGQAFKDRFEQVGNDAYAIVQRIVSLGVNYAAWRKDILADAEARGIAPEESKSVAIANTGFAKAMTDAVAQFDGLTDDQRAWVDQFFAGLGYTRSE